MGKKINCLIIGMVLVFQGLINVYAADDSAINSKVQLQEQHETEYDSTLEGTDKGLLRTDTITKILEKAQAGIIDFETAYAELEKMGVYAIDNGESEEVMPLSSPAAVTINRVSVVYDAAQAQWVVSGGGYWNNDAAWKADSSMSGYDGIGIKFYNTSGVYNSRVLYSSVYYSDGGSNEARHSNPNVSNGKEGTYFEYEDRYISGGLFGSDSYLGKHFSATIVYDKNFSNYHGYARAQYTHTWGSAVITSVGVGTDSFQIGISNVQNSFTCFSSGETVF